MSNELNVILYNVDTTKKYQKFLGKPRQKHHVLEFLASRTINIYKNVTNRQKLKNPKTSNS